MVLVCGGDGPRRRAIWSTEGLFTVAPSQERGFRRDGHGLARVEPGGHESEPIPNAEKYNCSTEVLGMGGIGLGWGMIRTFSDGRNRHNEKF